MLYQPWSSDVEGRSPTSEHYYRPKLGSKTYKKNELTASRKIRKSALVILICTILFGGYFILGQYNALGDSALASSQSNGAAPKNDQLALDVITRAKIVHLEDSLREVKYENEQLKAQLRHDKENSSPRGAQSEEIQSGPSDTLQGRDQQMLLEYSSFKDKMSNYRFYCMVPTIFAEHRKAKIEAVVSTWGKRCDVIKLFIDPAPKGTIFPKYFPSSDPSVKVEMVQLPLVRQNDEMSKDKRYTTASCKQHGVAVPCRHIWEKVWRAWDYIYDNDLESADFFAKIDDDTFFFVEFAKLHFALNNWDPEEPRYFGHVSHLAPRPFVNGAWVGVSRGALRKVVPLYKTMPNEYGPREKFARNRCVDRDGASQEVVEAICMFDAGIQPTTLEDRFGMQKVNLMRISDALYLRKREGTHSWYWYKKPQSSICCSEIPVAFHWYKDPSDLFRLEEFMYNQSNTFLESEVYSRPLVDKLKQNPGARVKGVISKVSHIPTYVYWDEIHYLWKVKQNLLALH